MTEPRKRLDPEVFELPVEKMRDGYYTDAYFNYARAALLADGRHPRVLMQVFQKKRAILGGIDEAIAILEAVLGRLGRSHGASAPRRRRDRAVGDRADDRGRLHLVRRTSRPSTWACSRGGRSISTNVRRVVEAASGEGDPLLPRPARPPPGADGRRVRGARRRRDRRLHRCAGLVVGRAWDRNRPARAHRRVRGDTVLAARTFAEWAPRGHERRRSRRLRQRLGEDVARGRPRARARLWGVRLDTSGDLVDRSLWDEMGDFDPRGVNERLVRNVRAALDDEGFAHVKIVASGGFTVEKIRAFEERGVPVDAYGVGSSLIRGENDFTADVVVTTASRAGRSAAGYVPNPRLERVSSERARSARARRPSARSSGRRALRARRTRRTRDRRRRCSRRRSERPRATCSPRGGRGAAAPSSWAAGSSSRSATVHATQWLFACPATSTASKPSRCSTSAVVALRPSISSAASAEHLGAEHRVVLGQRRRTP